MKKQSQLLVAAFFLLPGTLTQAQAVASGREYTVKTGDTLESIALRLLGSAGKWRDLMTANPEIKNKDFIKPGSTLKIGQTVAAKRAIIQQIFRQVEQMPFPRPWAPASVGGILQERDGVRTFEKSSSELQFDNNSKMIVSEESVVFLREGTPAPQNVSRKAIEIRAGQADLDVGGGENGRQNDIELHIGNTRATTRAAPGGKGASRARRTADGGSRIMVYDGESEVNAGGQTVAVSPGMGIAVTFDGKTNGPERLLSAPKPVTPNESQNFDFSNPTFEWEPSPGAATYTVDVCRNPECAQLVDRAAGVRGTRWTPRVLPIGALYWRVSAVTASGLDSPVSTPLKFSIRTYWRRPIG